MKYGDKEKKDEDLFIKCEEKSLSNDLPPAALRALKEAEERRKHALKDSIKMKEIGGPSGKDPSRYGDWEVKGRAIDF